MHTALWGCWVANFFRDQEIPQNGNGCFCAISIVATCKPKGLAVIDTTEVNLGIIRWQIPAPESRRGGRLIEGIRMAVQQIAIQTKDGECPTHVVTPDGEGPWPAVIFYMDAGGIRPALIDMAQQLAAGGYLVLLPDLFYRYGPYDPFVPAEVFKGDFRAILGPLMATTDNVKAAEDTGALIAYLDTRSDVTGSDIGAVGFCMGGRMALTAAGTYPDRFAAVASYHGGNLATDEPTSPHLLAPRLKAQVYIAAADNDGSYPPEMAKRLEAAFSAAGVQYCAETYLAAHGWMMPDFPIYNQAAAARGWSEMLALFGRALNRSAQGGAQN